MFLSDFIKRTIKQIKRFKYWLAFIILSLCEMSSLNAISKQLQESGEHDKAELIVFIESITRFIEKNKVVRQGERNMVDLKDVIVKYYYNPFTKGSNSIKYILPAMVMLVEHFLNDLI